MLPVDALGRLAGRPMSWFSWLTLALVVAVISAVSGVGPSGARPASRTQLMTAARWIAVCAAGLVLLLMLRAAR
jgi:hypothetical protein